LRSVLKKYESKSRPGHYQEVRLGGDNKVYCTCWGWRKNKTCEHLEDYRGLCVSVVAAPSSSTNMIAAYEEIMNKSAGNSLVDVVNSIKSGRW
jgi:hypothetical protein